MPGQWTPSVKNIIYELTRQGMITSDDQRRFMQGKQQTTSCVIGTINERIRILAVGRYLPGIH